MKKEKTILSNKQDPGVDVVLLPRLKFMGILMFIFAFAAFSYALFEEEEWIMNETKIPQSLKEIDPEQTWQTTTLIEVENTYVLSPYLAAISFVLVGSYSLLYVKLKRRALQTSEISKD